MFISILDSLSMISIHLLPSIPPSNILILQAANLAPEYIPFKFAHSCLHFASSLLLLLLIPILSPLLSFEKPTPTLITLL